MLKSEALARTVPRIPTTSKNGLAVVFSLAASSAVGLGVAGSRTGFVTVVLGLLVVSSIILSPVCAKRNGYRTAIGIGAVTILSATAILVSGSINPVISPEGFSVSTWAFIQAVLIGFAYRAYKENRLRPYTTTSVSFIRPASFSSQMMYSKDLAEK